MNEPTARTRTFVAFWLALCCVSATAQSNLARDGTWWKSMTATQRYIWTEAYLIGVKRGVQLRSFSASSSATPDEAWWASSAEVERSYRYLAPGELRDRLNKLYDSEGTQSLPVEDALGCAIPLNKEGKFDQLCVALSNSVNEARRKEAAEAAKPR